MISRALLNAPFFIPKDADLLRNRKVNTKKRQNRHLPELAFLILGTYFTAPFLLPKNKRRITEKTDIYACGMEKIKIIYLKHGTKNGMRKIECYMKAWRLQRRCGIYSI